MKIMVINGPNLNLLGVREPMIYGTKTLVDLEKMMLDYVVEMGIELKFYQSNHEGAIVDKIHEAYFNKMDGIILNPAAYTHTSVALLDALKAIGIPCVEVHLSDISKREGFRKTSYVKEVCVKTISGLGFDGYLRAIDELRRLLG